MSEQGLIDSIGAASTDIREIREEMAGHTTDLNNLYTMVEKLRRRVYSLELKVRKNRPEE